MKNNSRSVDFFDYYLTFSWPFSAKFLSTSVNKQKRISRKKCLKDNSGLLKTFVQLYVCKYYCKLNQIERVAFSLI